MFKELMRELKQLEQGMQISIPIASDEKGYIDKECPREECRFIFKVKAEDWKNRFKDEAVFCPRCRKEAPADNWWTTEQVNKARRQAERYALAEIQGRINRALHKDARLFNQRQPRNAFLKMSLSVSGKQPPKPVILPMTAWEVMEQEIQCEQCSARYAVIGCAYFCPCCGYNSVEKTFDDSLRKVEAKIDHIDTIRLALESTVGKDEAEFTCQSLIETCFSDCVVAYQRLAEQLYSRVLGVTKPPMNVFQRLEQGSDLWRNALGEGYDDWLESHELELLNTFFQRRHLLAHTEGIVDARYLRQSNDTDYQVGQRIVVTKMDVRCLVNLIRKLADRLRAKLSEFIP